jgi:GntR family transcriptional regulator/MocR family aminotransferase
MGPVDCARGKAAHRRGARLSGPGGLPRLREAIASYLAVSRGVLCEPEQVVITGGYQTAISMLARLLLGSRESVWLEDPGYFLARQALQVVSKHVVPVPVDDDGICIDLAVARAPGARVAVVTPAHQSPLGVALALNRRQKLLAWATASDAWIIEDDYDGEFHYVGRKLPALKSLDTADRVIYAGSFSKTLFPSLRLGYIVVPTSLLRNVIDTMCATHHGMQALGQMVAADFIAEGHFARHLKRMRGLYAARREALASALVESFGNRIKLVLQPGGMHLIVRFCDRIVDTELVRRSLAHRLAPTALSTHYIGRMRDHGLLLSFTNIPEAQAARHAKALLQAVA